jgi:hypothetical protein
MDGVRRASAHEIVFQAREGGPELNCCSVNSPRGLGMLSDWALMSTRDELRAREALVVNYYGPSRIELETGSGVSVTLTQETDYPATGRILLRVDPDRACTLPVKLRVPRWSAESRASLNGQSIAGVTPGTYLTIERTWKPGDTVTLDLGLSLHAWAGERESAGLTALYRGPILLAYDHRYNLELVSGRPPSVRPESARDLRDAPRLWMPVLDEGPMEASAMEWEGLLAPWLLFEFRSEDGRPVRLCDFASAGETGTPYRSWLELSYAPEPRPYARDNPLRSRPL